MLTFSVKGRSMFTELDGNAYSTLVQRIYGLISSVYISQTQQQ